MESASSIQKVLQPTLSVAVVALFIDAISLSSYGRSPAYSDLSQLVNSMTPNIGYLAIILTLTFLIFILPAISLALVFNALAYHILAWPFKRMRIARVHSRFLKRKMISRDLAFQYAQYHGMSALTNELDEDLKRLGKSPMQPFIPLLVIVLTTYIALKSSPTHPNFLMKVCSLEAPVPSCASYRIVLALVYIQAFLLMALNHQLFRSQRWYPKGALPVPASEILTFGRSAHKDRFSAARAKWMRGGTEGGIPERDSSSSSPIGGDGRAR